MTMQFISHRCTNTQKERKLQDHLSDVGKKTGEFAKSFASEEWGYLAGLWHDLGKYNQEFQEYIRKVTEQEEDAHKDKKQASGPDHSTAGALHAIDRFKTENKEILGRILAYIIAGHHAGLANWDSLYNQRLLKPEHLQKIQQNPPEHILNFPLPTTAPPNGTLPALWIRMLFSCLVDADFLDTESFLNQEQSNKRAGHPSLSTLKREFDKHMDSFKDKEATEVNTVRNEILKQCRTKACLEPGHFSLTAPTGGGKTLASLTFAMEHALKYNKQRIIYVIPYTSIIEQTADVFKNALGQYKDSVIEHHSNFDDEQGKSAQKSRYRLATENWDAPVIVTTTVQFFESLFAVRTSRVRKLHNICSSVVVLDEAQLLPPKFLHPICDTLNQLVKAYGVTFILSTATQPALGKRNTLEGRNFPGLENVREIIDVPKQFYNTLKRVEIHLPKDDNQGNWQDIATKLGEYTKALCIVNRRQDCRALYKIMPDGTKHLSALMCPEHRSQVIAKIKEILEDNQPLKVISTQLVEAGVDFDFPVVYRSMAGLDSIAQAAGRCNREGKLGKEGGKVVVFNAPKDPPRGILLQAAQATKDVIRNSSEDIFAPKMFTKYFENFYMRLPSHDEEGLMKLLEYNCDLTFSFRTAASKFKLIDDDIYLPIVVRYGEGNKYVEQLLNGLQPERWLWRKLQRYTITIPKDEHKKLVEQKEIKEVAPGLYVQCRQELYDEELGFCYDKILEYEKDSLVA